MKKTLSAVLAGGDMRQVYLGRLLRQDGFRIGAVALERHGEELEPLDTESFRTADVIILPMPVMADRGRMNAPLANAPHKITDILDAIPAGKLVFGGAVPKSVHEMAERRGITVADYLERGELAVLNAIPTAEGAIQIAMEELPVTLHDSRALVIGNG
ncbi:MAG: dipicolinate synthase subunit DpsA, partial [Butyricicoccaceae bacterium]